MTPVEIEVGTALPVQRVAVRAAAMKVFSLLTADPNPIHWDVAAVRAQGLGERPVNQGGLNAGYLARAVTDWAGDTGVLRTLRVRFRGGVAAGDTVTVHGTVSRVDRDGPLIRAVIDVWLRDADGADVADGTAEVAFSAPPGRAEEGSRPA